MEGGANANGVMIIKFFFKYEFFKILKYLN